MVETVKIKRGDAMSQSFCALKILVFLACLNASALPLVQVIGSLAIYLSILLTVLTIIFCSKNILLTRQHFILTIYAVLCVIVGLFTSISLSTVCQILLIAWISVYSNYLGGKVILKGVSQILSALLLFCFVDAIAFRVSGSALLFGNPNRIGIIAFLYVATEILYKSKARIFHVICGLAVILLSGARTPLLILFLGIILYGVLLKTKRVGTAKFLFLLILAAGALFISLYIHAQEYPSMVELNETVYNLTGKNLFSGRQTLWKSIFENYDYDKILFGYGLDFDISNLTGKNISSHNQFIQVLVQQGLFGLVLWIAFLFAIFINSFKKGNKKACTFALMIMFYNLFEVFLLQNHFALGLIVWLILFADGRCAKKTHSRLINIHSAAQGACI